MAEADSFMLDLAEGGDSLETSFANVVFNSLLPCTATSESACQLVDHLSKLNEALFAAEFELREIPKAHGKLTLASLAEEGHDMSQIAAPKVKEAAFLLHRLLKTHSCIDRVTIPNAMLAAYGPLICDALKRSLSVRILHIGIRTSTVNFNLEDALCSMKGLEKLEFLALWTCYEPLFSLANVVHFCSSLTTLKVTELRITGRRARALVAALKESSTLKELSINGSVICESGRGEFAEYLRRNTSLVRLTVVADEIRRRNCFNWMAEGLLENTAIKDVKLINMLFDRENAELVARIFSENKIIRRFHIVYFPEALSLQPSTDYNMWNAALSSNDTLEELSLPFSIWNPTEWADFFWSAAGKACLKKIVIFVHFTAHHHLRSLCEVLRESGTEEKVSLGPYYVRDNVDLLYSKAFSGVDMFCFCNSSAPLVHRLQQFAHITSVRFSVAMGDTPLVSSIAAYVQGATSLRKLLLTLFTDDGDMEESVDASWTEIVGALTLNTSVRELGVHVDFEDEENGGECADMPALQESQIQRLAEAIRSSRIIRRVTFRAEQTTQIATFLRWFSEGVSDNYTLVSVVLRGTLDRDAARDYFKIRDTVRRNWGLVARAAHFLGGIEPDRRSAGALERVHRHSGLLEELAEQLSHSVDQTTLMVRQGLRDIEGLRDFMRLAGVVRDRVVCEPRHDHRHRLDTMNEYCWRLVRSYLVLDDVREPA
ncbi:hypothetical protein HPB50_007717 [Hyalomma asiaticum]|uniref:Uncharacterized protein n=1 Tax=Hyalomma asiaticum TaxID=266040 RepID=A0ACB7S128_HYAAI|nr:hypothetical protein HPB50_007717 [Hyalomma asiaticum]